MKFFNGLVTGGLISLAMWALIGMAFAEETPQVRALNLRISTEVGANLQCTTVAFDLQDKLSASQAEVKRLTDKYEPKPDEPKK